MDPGKHDTSGPGCTPFQGRRRSAAILATLLLGALAAHVAHRERVQPPRAFLTPSATPATQPALTADPNGRIAASWVNPDPSTAASHASYLTVLPDGGLAAVWWGGTREGATDVALFLARRSPGVDAQWSTPQVLLSPEDTRLEMQRNVRKLGNAVLFPDARGHLYLVYVSVSVGGWSGSALNVKRSLDGGVTWSTSERLSVGPLLNFSTLVRARPVFTSDGWIGLPVYHEFVAKYPQMLWLKPGQERAVDQFHLRQSSDVKGLLQPVVVPLDGTRALMVMRDSSDERRLRTAFSEDAGWTWSAPLAVGLDNPDSSVDAALLPDGRLLLAYNEGQTGRHRLRLALSRDGGRSWLPGPYVENEESGEFSYPSLAVDPAGSVHLTYTWKRERIRHVQFDAAWLDRPGSELVTAKL